MLKVPGDLSRPESGWGQGVPAAVGVHLQSRVPLPTQVSRQKAGEWGGVWGVGGELAAASLLRCRQAGGDGPGGSGSGQGPAPFLQPLSTHQVEHEGAVVLHCPLTKPQTWS